MIHEIVSSFKNMKLFSFFLRSERMILYNATIDIEADYFSMGELGKLGIVEIIDISGNGNPASLKYYELVKLCDELQHKLESIMVEIKQNKIDVVQELGNVEVPAINYLTNLNIEVSELHDQIFATKKAVEELAKSMDRHREICFMLSSFGDLYINRNYQSQELGNFEIEAQNLLSDIIGIGDSESMKALGHTINYLTRGKACFYIVGEPYTAFKASTKKTVTKSVFRIMTHGEEFTKKCVHVCDALGIPVYQNLKTSEIFQSKILEFSDILRDVESTYTTTLNLYEDKLNFAAQRFSRWISELLKGKTIFENLNKCSYESFQNCFVMRFWCPMSEENSMGAALDNAMFMSRVSTHPILHKLSPHEHPPTYNHWTQSYMPSFQALIDSYGVANYREINPASIYLITFPFLFSVMFADLGHGFVVFIAGLLMILFKSSIERNLTDLTKMIFDARYLILFMGIFSLYSGIVYNDCLSKAITIFSGGWNEAVKNKIKTLENLEGSKSHESMIVLDPKDFTSPYMFGLDSIWYFATNKLTFSNSLKMKLSIIFSSFHNAFGLFIKLKNLMFFDQISEIFLVLLPETVFFFSTFGYLTFLIFLKWIIIDATSPNQPSIMKIFTGMFMEPHKPLKSDVQLYTGQKLVQSLLLFLTIISIIWMLLSKPLYIMYRRKYSTDPHFYTIRNNDDSEGECVNFHVENEEDDFNAVVIHQSIHTIEYCLGCISSTASYLRLWALSLAHSELSEVLWMLMSVFAFKRTGVVGLIMNVITSGIWMSFTISLMIMMEGLSAFLHSLRLHWVEFQGKFFGGSGHLFEPFSFKSIHENVNEKFFSSS